MLDAVVGLFNQFYDTIAVATRMETSGEIAARRANERLAQGDEAAGRRYINIDGNSSYVPQE